MTRMLLDKPLRKSAVQAPETCGRDSIDGEDLLTQLNSRGHELLEHGRYEDAGVPFETLVSKYPDHHHGYFGLAHQAELQWKWTAALQHWDRALQAAPPELHNQVIRRKAECLLQIGGVSEATRLLESIRDQVVGLEGLAQLAMLQDTPHVAGQLWDECAAKFPNEIYGFFGKARLLFAREAYREADALLQHAVALWPGSVEAAVLWAQCATAAKNWDSADSRWQAILPGHQDNSDVIRGYARYLAATDNGPASEAFLGRIRANIRAHAEFCAEQYLATDDFGAALEPLQQLIGLESENPGRRLRYATVLMREGSSRGLHAAFWLLRDLHDRSPRMITVTCNLTEALIKLGSEGDAADLIAAIPGEERRTEVEVLRAWLHHREGDDATAKCGWTEILERQYVAAVHAPIWNLNKFGNDNVRIGPDQIVLFTAMRNERPRLDWFLNYYRGLGVDRFVVVDNGSTDGSIEFLKEESDVVLYSTSDQYSMSGSGMRWINELIERYGKQSWCLHVDADEAFIFPSWQNIGLRGLVRYLDEEGYECMLAKLIDLYPAKVPRASSSADIARIQSSYVHFDDRIDEFGAPICPYTEIYGGVRRRLLGGYQMLNKVPLIKGSARLKFLLSSHRTTPGRLADVTGAMLHYHLVYLLEPTYEALFRDAIERREFPSNSLERVRSREVLGKMCAAESLLDESSVQIEQTGSGLTAGLMRSSDKFAEFTSRD